MLNDQRVYQLWVVWWGWSSSFTGIPSHPPTKVTNAGLYRVSPRRAGLRNSDFLAILDFYVYENGGMPHPKLQHTNRNMMFSYVFNIFQPSHFGALTFSTHGRSVSAAAEKRGAVPRMREERREKAGCFKQFRTSPTKSWGINVEICWDLCHHMMPGCVLQWQ